MDYSVGDKLIHPKHGAGQISAIEHCELVEGFEHYYVIQILDQALTVHIPMSKMDELGVRPAMRQDKVAQVMDTLCSVPRQLSSDYKARQSRIHERLQSGRPMEVAKVVRDLTARKRDASLTTGDSKLLARGRNFLAAEIALVTGAAVDEAKLVMDAAMRVAAPIEQPV